MNSKTQFAFLKNVEKHLVEAKSRTLKWRTVCYSQTNSNCTATISYYASMNPYACGDIVLFPGLATNTEIDPLMKSLLFWALTHRRNVFTVDTFVGDFKEQISFTEAREFATKNTYKEFVTLIEQSIKFIQHYTIPNKNILVGHSAGATGLTNAMNNLTEQNVKTNIGSVILFAPCFGNLQRGTIDNAVKRRMESNHSEYPEGVLVMPNAQDIWLTKKMRHIYIAPNFISDMFTSAFKPDLMNKWGTYITIVAAEKDTKVSFNYLKQYFDKMVQGNNSDLFRFIPLQNTQHCILLANQNNKQIVNVIKTQKTK